MIEKDALIVNKLGLHARATSKLVKLASTFNSHIEIENDGQRVNAKSIMGVMMLAASKGTTVTLHAEGNDEQEAISALEQLIAQQFGETE